MTPYSPLKNALNSHRIYLRLLIISGLALTIFLSVRGFQLYLPDLEKWLQGMGAFGFIAFIALFVVATPLFISVDTLCFVAGVLFPLLPGILYVAVATYGAAAVIFILGRYFFREKVTLLLRKHQKLSKLNDVLANDGLHVMLLLRLLPLPFAWLSYALSVTQVQLKPYLIATSGILIYNTALVYFGYATKHVLTAVSGPHSASFIHEGLLVGIGIIAALILIIIVHKARRAMLKIAPELAGQNTLDSN